MTTLESQPEGYRQAWADRRFRILLLVTAVALPVTLWTFSVFLLWVEERPGAVLDDPVLAALPSVDVSLPTFALIYGGIVLALAALLRSPRRMLQLLLAYVLLISFRCLCIWLTPLDPPIGFLQLDDPLIESFGPAKALSRDLFFSGHTSTLFLVSLSARSKRLRVPLFAATAVVACLLLVQHAHYTIDVVVAPLVSFSAFSAAGWLTRPTPQPEPAL